MQAIDLCDLVTLEKTGEGITLTCDSKEIPLGEDNLAFRAAMLMRKEYHIPLGVHINSARFSALQEFYREKTEGKKQP